jgi:hypothetical protein
MFGENVPLFPTHRKKAALRKRNKHTQARLRKLTKTKGKKK